MELNSLPLWAQQLGALFVTVATAIGLTWSERRKRKDETKPLAAGGEREVVAASFIGTRQMDNATAGLRSINSTLIKVCAHLEKITDRAHEDETVRAAVERIKAERG